MHDIWFFLSLVLLCLCHLSLLLCCHYFMQFNTRLTKFSSVLVTWTSTKKQYYVLTWKINYTIANTLREVNFLHKTEILLPSSPVLCVKCHPTVIYLYKVSVKNDLLYTGNLNIESRNHRIVWVGRDLKDHLTPTSL